MSTAQILKDIREKQSLTQEQMAQRLMVTPQAISRWETGQTEPGIESLRLISRLFGLSINTLLGSPQQLICQCCGMPLVEDGHISREPDGSFNEAYCTWCYTQGQYSYQHMDQLLDYLCDHFNPEGLSAEHLHAQYAPMLSQLDHWRPQGGQADGQTHDQG